MNRQKFRERYSEERTTCTHDENETSQCDLVQAHTAASQPVT